MKDRNSISKNERWAKLSQKAEDRTAFKKLKDGQKHIRSSKMAKLSLKAKRLLNASE
jgi:hypothetical protein